MNRSTLGATIRARRLALGWSQEELAARVSALDGEWRPTDVSRLERGKVTLPRHARLAALAEALGLSLGALLVRTGWDGYGEAADAVTTAAVDGPRLHDLDPSGERPAPPTAKADSRLARVMREAAATRERSVRLLQKLDAEWGPEPRLALARRPPDRVPEESDAASDAEADDETVRPDAPPVAG